MAVQAERRQRAATPARWAAAVTRAVEQGIQVRQINTTGAWVATSGTDANVSYLMEIVAGHVLSCSCPAGQFGDPCCKHAAKFYLDAGLLDPEPEPPAPAIADCAACRGCGVLYDRGLERAGLLYPTCRVCRGTGIAPALPAAA